jgi:hypothetical protein
MVNESIKQCPLALQNFNVGGGQIEPGSAVDLRKGQHPAAFRRPFDLERVAHDRIDVEISFDRKRGHPLATALPDVAQRFKRTGKIATCLFEKLSPRGDGRVLALMHFAFWNRPGPLVLVPPKRPARMNQQDFHSVPVCRYIRIPALTAMKSFSFGADASQKNRSLQ